MNTLSRHTRPFGFDHLPQDWFSGFAAPEYRNNFVPSVNIEETDEKYVVSLVVPGFQKENFKLKSTEKMLEVSATVEKKEESTENKFTRKEFSLRSFSRSFNLPEGKVNIDDISASYENGILAIGLPKKEAAKPVEKLIDIK